MKHDHSGFSNREILVQRREVEKQKLRERGSERRGGQDFEQIEVVIVGTSCEPDSCFDSRGHGETLERRPGRGLNKLLQDAEALHGRRGNKRDAQHALRAHIARVARHVREGAAQISAHSDVRARGAETEIHGCALLGGFADAVFLNGLRNPGHSDAVFAVLEREDLDEEDLFELRGVGGD